MQSEKVVLASKLAGGLYNILLLYLGSFLAFNYFSFSSVLAIFYRAANFFFIPPSWVSSKYLANFGLDLILFYKAILTKAAAFLASIVFFSLAACVKLVTKANISRISIYFI
jgi:hypothetical protein